MNKDVFKYFEEILKIPRESGKEEKIAKYLASFAKQNDIEYKIGKYNTIFLRKDNNQGKTIILQAHSDMVCVSNDNYDFDNKGIPYYIDGDYYKSKNTSLGADDGIGIAIILAILQENENMPNIEVMITTQEETTMLGANNFDYSLLTGKTLISLDGIKEADIEASSTGMCSITISKKVEFKENNENGYKLSVKGLMGGHSGDDISKNRCNAIKLIMKILKEIDCSEIISIDIGKRDNVIPSEGEVRFLSKHNLNYIDNKIKNIDLSLYNDGTNFRYDIEQIKENKVIMESKDIINLIHQMKDGLIEKYEEDGFPLLSSNIGKVLIENNEVVIKYSIRSSDKLKERSLLDEVYKLCNKYGFEFKIDAEKPFFPFKKSSNIRRLLESSYKKLYGKNTIIKKVHACMECGIISNNIKDLDICTIAPDIENCHSINEQLSISSTKRVYEWLKYTLVKYNQNIDN